MPNRIVRWNWNNRLYVETPAAQWGDAMRRYHLDPERVPAPMPQGHIMFDPDNGYFDCTPVDPAALDAPAFLGPLFALMEVAP